MSLPISQQAKYWGLSTAVFLLLLWLLGDILLPFFVGAAVAYFLDPVADRLETAGLSRAMATLTNKPSASISYMKCQTMTSAWGQAV